MFGAREVVGQTVGIQGEVLRLAAEYIIAVFVAARERNDSEVFQLQPVALGLQTGAVELRLLHLLALLWVRF